MRSKAALLGAMVLLHGNSGSAAIPRSPVLVSPGSPVTTPLVASPCPTFSWATLGEAHAIELVVYRLATGDEEEGETDSEALFQVTLPGTAAAWTPSADRCLDPGERYAWSARTWVGDEPSAWSEASFFRAPGDPSVEEVRQALSVLERFTAGESGPVSRPDPEAAFPYGAEAPAAEKTGAAIAPAATGPVPTSHSSGAAIRVDGFGVVTDAAMVLSTNDLRAATTGLNDQQQLTSGDDVRLQVTMPFGIEIAGTTHTALTISSNGWVEFGGNTVTSVLDYENACLPTLATSNPLLAAYWDDLELEGNGIVAGWIGAAPNRAYIIAWQAHPLADAAQDAIFQVQILEGSGLINVSYVNAPSGATEQSATIGFQGAGGSAARAYPVICKGSLLWPSAAASGAGLRAGWSIAPIR